MHGHNNTPLARYDFGGRCGGGGGSWFFVMFCDDLLLLFFCGGWGVGGGGLRKAEMGYTLAILFECFERIVIALKTMRILCAV